MKNLVLVLALFAACARPTASAVQSNSTAAAAVNSTLAAAPRAWTFLIYAACDNDAEADDNFMAFLDGVRAAMSDDAGLDIVLFIDRSAKYSNNSRTLGEDFTDARLYHVRAKGCERLAGGEWFPEITLTSRFEPNSGDPRNVAKFMAFGKARFPAAHTALMLYGHANGVFMCPDEESEGRMGFAELTQVVPANASVDLMALELCTMGGIEIAYQWRPGNGGFSTQTLVAIPNAGPPLAWDRVFRKLRKGDGIDASSARGIDPATLTGADFGRLIVEECGAARREAKENHEAVAAYDLTNSAAVKHAVDALAQELGRTDGKEIVEELRGPGPAGYTLNYSRDRLDRGPFIDLYDLCARIAACDRLAAAVRDAAKAVLGPVDEFVLASHGGSALARFEAGRCGVYIVFPDGDAQGPGSGGRRERVWSMMGFYSPLPDKGNLGRLAWCADGATAGNVKVENWFELLDFWFDDVKAKPEGTNGYAP